MSKSIELVPWQEDQKKAVEEGAEAAEALQVLGDVKICTAEDMDSWAGILQEMKGKMKELKARRDKATKPMSEALEEVRSWFRAPLKHYEACEKVIKAKLAAAYTEQTMAQQASLEAAVDLSKGGDTEAAKTALEKSKTGAHVPNGVSFIETWDFEVEDFSKIPREYLCVDGQRVAAEVKKSKAGTKIPGIKPILKSRVSARSK